MPEDTGQWAEDQESKMQKGKELAGQTVLRKTNPDRYLTVLGIMDAMTRAQDEVSTFQSKQYARTPTN